MRINFLKGLELESEPPGVKLRYIRLKEPVCDFRLNALKYPLFPSLPLGLAIFNCD